MTRPKVAPEKLLLFREMVARAKSEKDWSITQAEYQRLESAFIAAQGTPGTPVFLWGLGHRRRLREALTSAGVCVLK
jgi:hypothetical protein